MIAQLRAIVTAACWAAFLCPGQAHDIYSDWKMPGTEHSCCHNRDCYPTEAKFENGQWFALRREDQRWLAVPPNALLTDGATPEGNAHLCAPPPITEDDTRVYCFRPPAMGI